MQDSGGKLRPSAGIECRTVYPIPQSGSRLTSRWIGANDRGIWNDYRAGKVFDVARIGGNQGGVNAQGGCGLA